MDAFFLHYKKGGSGGGSSSSSNPDLSQQLSPSTAASQRTRLELELSFSIVYAGSSSTPSSSSSSSSSSCARLTLRFRCRCSVEHAKGCDGLLHRHHVRPSLPPPHPRAIFALRSAVFFSMCLFCGVRLSFRRLYLLTSEKISTTL
jgi:hypothetical protein